MLPILGRIALDLGRAEHLHEVFVLVFQGDQFIEHRSVPVIRTPPETGGRNATSSPSASARSIRA